MVIHILISILTICILEWTFVPRPNRHLSRSLRSYLHRWSLPVPRIWPSVNCSSKTGKMNYLRYSCIFWLIESDSHLPRYAAVWHRLYKASSQDGCILCSFQTSSPCLHIEMPDCKTEKWGVLIEWKQSGKPVTTKLSDLWLIPKWFSKSFDPVVRERAHQGNSNVTQHPIVEFTIGSLFTKDQNYLSYSLALSFLRISLREMGSPMVR